MNRRLSPMRRQKSDNSGLGSRRPAMDSFCSIPSTSEAAAFAEGSIVNYGVLLGPQARYQREPIARACFVPRSPDQNKGC
jgi:hypothetical protein